MKSLLLTLLFVGLFATTTFAQNSDKQAQIRSIDDGEIYFPIQAVSEEGLPQDHYDQLLKLMTVFQFTVMPEAQVEAQFELFELNPLLRMKNPAGKCGYRRAYLQNAYLKENIITGQLLVRCPSNNGRLRLRDQVSGRHYSYSNFHDTSIVAVQTSQGIEFRVLDVQFEDGPVSLHDYLSEIEASQKIRPLKRKGTSSKLCYWTITTPHHSY